MVGNALSEHTIWSTADEEAQLPYLMQNSDFLYLSDLLRKRSGLALTEEKVYLIESRLLPIARQMAFDDVAGLCAHIRNIGGANETLMSQITEAMTTNESSFFRDNKPYEYLAKTILPMVMERQASSKYLRIWSAACSTGQEPYSIALCLEESNLLAGWRYDIIATDLAAKVVDKAKQGTYSQFDVQRGLTAQMLVKYFTKVGENSWKINPSISSKVEFRLQNLLGDYSGLGSFDIIFCRNVLIYFENDTKADITRKMKNALQSRGVLVIGSTESLVDPHNDFVQLDGFRGGYQLK